MSTYSRLHYHLVFGTKDRFPHIDKKWRDQLHAYMAATITGLEGTALQVGGIEDHVHLLITISPSLRIPDLVRDLKRSSTAWIQKEIGEDKFRWQEGYGIFTVSSSNLVEVKNYIKNQENHHKKMSFLDEYKLILEKVGVEFEERYLP